jgi:xanthine dehydrogenase YagR molybdenum-binding subunit
MTSVGKPLSRADGRLKVTGQARYTADVPLCDAVQGVIVHSTIANGRTLSIDTADALAAPGVLAVFTHMNMPRMNPLPKEWSQVHPTGQFYIPLQDDAIHYAGQPLALVIASTVDEAEYAGTLIKVDYDSHPPVSFNPDTAKHAVDPKVAADSPLQARLYWEPDASVGDADAAIAAAAVQIKQRYTTADRHHNQMEPHASLANWGADGSLTLFETTQGISGTKALVATVAGVSPDKVRVVSPFLGGGFGGKAYVWPHTLLAVFAAKVLRRPVRVQLTRAQMYSMVGHQPATIQTLTLGADRTGQLAGIRHDSVSPTSVFEHYIEYAANASKSLWKVGGGIATSHKVLRTHRNTPSPMRAPHEAVGLFAIESAMDELAYAVGVDPLALRLLNDAEIDPDTKRPFSTRGLRNCMIEGARRFGWDKRPAEPRSLRDGRNLIGYGMGTAIYTSWRWPAEARVILQADGTAIVESGMHDIGTGTYTVMRQVAADALSLPAEKVIVRLGDTRLPPSHGAIGSATMPNSGASVQLAATDLRNKAVALAISGPNAPLAGATASEVEVGDGVLTHSKTDRSISFANLLARRGLSTLQGDGHYKPIEEAKGPKAIFSFAAVFVEVRVDEALGLVRLNRVVGVYDAGKIINTRTARSQAVGGIIWGVGQALLEQSEIDPATARFLNRNYSGYLVPTNADIPDLDISFAGEFDGEASPLGAKGIGEVTAGGVAPAITNAIYHATGKRIRDLPVTIDKML